MTEFKKKDLKTTITRKTLKLIIMNQKLKKTGFALILLLVSLNNSIAQSTYNSTNYATVGDAFYFTTANNLSLDYSTTGTNFNWNFASLTGISQNELQFKSPNTTGYSFLTFPYIYNSNNTNLASTNGTTTLLNVAGKTIGTQDLNDYYKKTSTELTQVASAYKLNYNGTLIPVKNQYTIPDKIYTFPIKFGNTETNNSEYTVNIPGVYYQSKTVERTNLVDGWGSVITPFGNFPNVLRMKTTLVESDSISIGDEGLPKVIRTSRELKWFDTSKKNPVLIVTQSYVANIWTTTKIEYLDAKKDFQTTALFAFTPALPTAGATVYFQNLSANATAYVWDFGDPSSGSSNSSIELNPTHIFSTNGAYNVKLTSSNDSFTKSITLPVIVSDITLGIETNIKSEKIKIYPNPFSNYISISGENNPSEYELSNLEGKVFYKGKTINNKDLSFLSKGIYLLKVTDNNKTTTFKLVKN